MSSDDTTNSDKEPEGVLHLQPVSNCAVVVTFQDLLHKADKALHTKLSQKRTWMHLTLQCSGQSALCKLWLVLFKNVLFKTPRFSAKRMSNLSVISLSLASTYRNGLQPTSGGFASSHTFPCKLVCQFGLEGTACGHAFFMWRRGDAASTRSSRSASLALGYFQVLLFSFF